MLVHLVPTSTSYKNRLLIAGIAAVGASLIALNPMSQTLHGVPPVQHRAVQLTAGEEDWSQVLATAQDNLAALEGDASTASTELSTAENALSTEFSGQISTALTGFETGLQNSIDGGWYGGDDGYVFGLFGGSVTGPDGVETGSTLTEISQALSSGNAEQAFSYFDTWSLETLDHSLKPLLAPLLDETSKGVTTLSIPTELSQIQTSLLETFGTYTELKNLSDGLLSPELGVAFGLSSDLDGIATDLSSGDYTDALTAFNNLPSDLTGDLLNGWDSGPGVEPFVGLLTDAGSSTGGLLQDLLITWPEQLAGAL
jgi:hypothetical protein